MNIEVAVFALVETAVDGFTANVTTQVSSRVRMVGVANHIVSKRVVVEEGGESMGVVVVVGEIHCCQSHFSP